VCAVSYTQVKAAVRRLPGTAPVLSLEPGSLADIFLSIETVGEAVGKSDAGRALADSLRRRVAAVEALAAPHPRPRMACIEWTDPLMAGGHWVPEMVRLAGAEDPLGREGAPSGYVSWDELTAADPEILVLMPCGYSLDQTLAAANDVLDHPDFSSLACSRSGRVVAVDGSGYFNRPGPRIVDGLEILAAIVRRRPGEELPAGARWVL
jgi:iron complex transport system substrate-binding protein